MMTGMSTLTSPGIPTLTGPGAPVLDGFRDTHANWFRDTHAAWFRDMDAHAGRPRDAYTGDSRMSVLTLTSQGVPILLGSNTACSNYVFNFVFMVIFISADLLMI